VGNVRPASARRRRNASRRPSAAADDAEFQTRVGAFQQGLALLGWTISRNVRIDTRWATANVAEIRTHAAELVALAPDVILAHGDTAVGALLQATRTVPVVFPVIGDPVGAGFVDGLARPGGNVTGFMNYEYSISGKWLERLKAIAPGVTRVAVLRDAAISTGPAQFGVIPGRSAVAQGGGKPGQCARRRRDRARRRGFRALREWRPDRDG
jgi:putative ABC transport system substrate-binding protein